jgi:rhodanese-related sulfurtransferase
MNISRGKQILMFAAFPICVNVLFASKNAIGQTSAQPLLDAFVPKISSNVLIKTMRGGSKILIYDIREREEFAVSRISGAIYVNPAISPELAASRIVARARGATVVFYCTIGIRSVDFAQGVYHDLMASGAIKVFVLEGGIIDWHNQGLPLVDQNGPSKSVHPFNEELKGRLKKPELARASLLNYR